MSMHKIVVPPAGYDSPELRDRLNGAGGCSCQRCAIRRLLPTQGEMLTADLLRHDAQLHRIERQRAAELAARENVARERAERLHRWTWRANWLSLGIAALSLLLTAVVRPEARVPVGVALMALVVVAAVLPGWQLLERQREGLDAQPTSGLRSTDVPLPAGTDDLDRTAVDAAGGGARG